jgi:hypothetical protein
MTSPRKRIAHIVLLALTALALVDCGDKARCNTVRDETYQKRVTWARCDADADCIVLAGNQSDCTGVLACPFAIHRSHREEAERLLLTIGEDSVDCHICAVPTCTGGATTCEQSSHQCVMSYTGVILPPFDRPDSNPPLPPDDTDASAD